jgi:hypothetical protein
LSVRCVSFRKKETPPAHHSMSLDWGIETIIVWVILGFTIVGLLLEIKAKYYVYYPFPVRWMAFFLYCAT